MDASSDISVSSSSSSSTIPVTPNDQKEKSPTIPSPATTGKSAGRHRQVTAPSFHYETYGIFDWNSYLEEVGGTPAPDKCFKQSIEPPENEFMSGMKLEARDPRNSSSTTIASVVYPFGSRLQLRLEGSDNTNDFFELVDSASIQPIGTCDKNGEMLQPPLGFRRNPSQWPNFMVNALQNALIAPNSAFKREPPDPEENYFEVGMKLEAVDRKNPRLICPATVGAVKDNQIFVTFDGWKGAFDYWCDYRSRELFPVGWCRNSGHPLQPPGNRAPTDHIKAKMMSAGIKSSVTTSSSSATPASASQTSDHNNKHVNGSSKSHPFQNPKHKSFRSVVSDKPPTPVEQNGSNGTKARTETKDESKTAVRVDGSQLASRTVTPKRTKTTTFASKSTTTKVSAETIRSSRLASGETVPAKPHANQVQSISELGATDDGVVPETLKRKLPEDEMPEVVLDTKSRVEPNHRTLTGKTVRLAKELEPKSEKQTQNSSPPEVPIIASTPVPKSNLSFKAKSPSNLMEWTVDDVIAYLMTEDNSLNCSAIFHEHVSLTDHLS